MRTGAPATCRGTRGGRWQRGKGGHTPSPRTGLARVDLPCPGGGRFYVQVDHFVVDPRP
jgi:hypothetical protein